MRADLRAIAVALGGEVTGRQVLAPGPGHSLTDRSLSVRASPNSRDGFIVFSHAGDDFRDCRDHVRSRLGLPEEWRRKDEAPRRPAVPPQPDDDLERRIARARALWYEARDPRGTAVERYLQSRKLALEDDVAVTALRFHPRCPWRDEARNETIYVPAMIAAMRTVEGDSITAVHRTWLTPEGAKVDRKMLGPARGTAVKLDPDEAVTHGLAIGEGIETVLSARQLAFRPAWAMCSAGAIASLPVLSGVEAITLLAENDPSSDRAVKACATRWHEAGRAVAIVTPNLGSDMNDVLRGAA